MNINKKYYYDYFKSILLNMSNNSLLKKKENFNFISIGKKVFAIEIAGLQYLTNHINNDFHRACEIILQCHGKVVIMGVGKSGYIGRKIAATFSSTGTPSFFVHPIEASHGDLGMISKTDIITILSNSGESYEIIKLFPILKYLNIPLICMTSKPNSNIGKAATVHICINVPQEACPFGLVPTTSAAAMLIMGDALALALSRYRGFTTENFALFHPGGTIGKKLLLRVQDLMHIGDRIPFVFNNASLNEALIEISNKGLGMTVICDSSMRIQGIFTDGDFRRIIDIIRKTHLNQICITDVMTVGGICISPNVLAVEALNLLKNNHITTLLVSDKNRHLLGIIHIHDILRSGIV